MSDVKGVMREASKLTEGLTLEEAPEMMMLAGHIIEVCGFLEEDGDDDVPRDIYALLARLRRMADQANQKESAEAKERNHGLKAEIYAVHKKHPRWKPPRIAVELANKKVMQIDKDSGALHFKRADDRRNGRDYWTPIAQKVFDKHAREVIDGKWPKKAR